jgi:MFS family permease
VLAATMIVVGLSTAAATWIVMRFVSGACIAGLYVVAESWLNQLASNDNRGRILAVYMVVTSGAYGIGQVLVGQVNPRTVTAFALAAMLTSLAVAPVALSEDAVPPPIERTARMPLRQLARIVPTGVGTCLLVGITHGALVAMGVVYATKVGLTPSQAGRFIAATAVGGVLTQWPLSSASDEIDRRFVGVVAACGAIGASVWLLVSGPFGWQGLVAMALLGGASFPLYSIAAAYTNDWVEPEHVSGAASQLVLLYGAGALIGPPIVSVMISAIGNHGFPWAMIGMHAAIVVFLVYRLFAWRSPISKVPWNESSLAARAFFIPANVVWMGRRIGRRSVRRG